MDEMNVKNDTNQEKDREKTRDQLDELLTLARTRISGLEESLSAKEVEMATLQAAVRSLESKLKSSETDLAGAVEGYRTMVTRANTDILPELIAGKTLPEIESSLRQARAIVDRVKQGLEAGRDGDRYPAGMPERGDLNVSLSARDKITRGISVPR